MKYRVMAGRYDIPENIYVTFDAGSDDEARKQFEIYAKRPKLKWDGLRLVRVDQEEITTHLASLRI